MPDFIPAREADLVAFANNFAAIVASEYASLGVSSAQSAQLTSATDAFVSAYALVHNGMTRSPANLQLKEGQKRSMIATVRQVAGVIQKCPMVSDAQRASLALTVRSAPSRIAVPAEAPSLSVVSVVGRRVALRVYASGSERRGKPDKVASAHVYSFVGAVPPGDLSGWRFEASVTRTAFEVTFPPTVAGGAQVWFMAAWANPRNQLGPMSNPVTTCLQGVPGTVAS